jgi:DNA-binding transcriptional LysR family regulator
MEYKYLKAFILPAKHLSFSRAALELKIAQSAVSRQIKLLEESLGEALLVRSSKKVILTPRGEEFFKVASKFDSISRSLFKSSGIQTIRMGVLHGITENWLIGVISKHCKKNKINLKLHIDSPDNLEAAINAGKFDMIFTNKDVQSETITSLKLFREELVFISKSKINFEKIYEYKWIMYDDGDFLMKFYKKGCEDYIYVNSITAIISLVKKGAGIALIPSHVIKEEDDIIVTPLGKEHDINLYLSTINYEYYPKHMEKLINDIKMTCKQVTQ